MSHRFPYPWSIEILAMKFRSIAALAALAFLMAFTGCTPKPAATPAPGQETENKLATGVEPAGTDPSKAKPANLEDAARSFVELLSQGEYVKAVQDFDVTMSNAMPPEKLGQAWQRVQGQAGKFQKQGEVRTERVQQYDVCYVTCTFQKSPLDVKVVFTPERQITGLFFVPSRHPTAAKSDGPAIQLKTRTGTLHGTLDLPAGKGPFPIVILHAGSGPTDRDGNQFLLQNDSLKMLGKGLAKKGLAVLRYDKRGVGASATALAKEEDANVETYVADLAAWVELLRQDARFNGVSIVGHSEGALIGMLAARQARVDAYVSLAGLGQKPTVVLRKQLANKLPRELKEKSDKIMDELEAGRTVTDVPKELEVLFRPSVQPFLISLFRYDPVRELGGLKVPVLIVQGTTDIQEAIEDARLLAAGNKAAQLCLIEGMNHVLKKAKSQAEQDAAYNKTTVPIMPQVVDEVAAFLTKGAKNPG